MERIGNRIKERRMALGMSVQTLATRVGKSLATLYRYENSEIESIPVDVIKPLAIALNTTPEYLAGWEINNEKIISNIRPLSPYVKLPKLGAIRAGCPMSTNQVLNGEWDYADAEYGDGDHYILDVIGNSMAPTIPDGSEAIIRAQSYAEKGQIVAFGLDGEYATLKRYFPQADGTIFLRGDNPEAASYVVTQQQLENGEAFIIGVVRSYKVNL